MRHRRLQKRHAGKAGKRLGGGKQHDHRRAGADDDGVNQHAEGLHETHLRGMIAVCRGGRAGRGAGAGLIGEQAALDAVHQHGAEAAGDHLAQAECLGKDAGKDGGQQRRVPDEEENGEEEIRARHDRHHDIQHADSGVLAKDDHRGNGNQHDGGIQRGNGEGVFKRGGHGIADDLADAAPADQAGNGEEHGEDGLAQLPFAPALGKRMDIQRRAAAVAAVKRVVLFVKVGERRLDEGGGGADQRRHPHPEDRARAAGGDGGDDADQIAHAHARGGGDDERLNAGEGAAARLPLFKREAQHVGQKAHGQAARADGEVYAGGNQQDDQQRQPQRCAARQGNGDQIVPQKGVERLNRLDEGGNQRRKKG